jgi:hypothetical protein
VDELERGNFVVVVFEVVVVVIAGLEVVVLFRVLTPTLMTDLSSTISEKIVVFFGEAGIT